MNIKKLICIVCSAAILLALTACGEKSDSDKAGDPSSAASVPNKLITLGNTTVKEISEKLEALDLEDGFTLSLAEDRLGGEYAYVKYELLDSSKKTLATISSGSDLENKAASFAVGWNYAENTSELNAKLLDASKLLLKAAWNEYSEDNYKTLEQSFKLTVDYIDRFADMNITETAPTASGSGFISFIMSSGHFKLMVSYPNLVENV